MMFHSLLKKIFKFEPVTFLSPQSPINFYVIQFLTFGYAFYRLSSRDVSVYSQIPPEFFSYPRAFYLENWPMPPTYFFTGQFIYELLPRPNLNFILTLQYFAAGASILGLLGAFPRWMAAIIFVISVHFSGFIHATNAELSGGTLLSCSLLILAFTPSNLFYRIGHKANHEPSTKYGAPIFLVLLTMGAFYSFSGWQKVLQDGPEWPFLLRLDNYAHLCLEENLFVSYRLKTPDLCGIMTSKFLSHISGVITLVAETGFITVLLFPRLRIFFCILMIIMHSIVYYTHGINFTGNTFLILACLDWASYFDSLKRNLPLLWTTQRR